MWQWHIDSVSRKWRGPFLILLVAVGATPLAMLSAAGRAPADRAEAFRLCSAHARRSLGLAGDLDECQVDATRASSRSGRVRR